MIYLHTLGDALIKVGEKEIRPTAPMLFAALLYLAVERGRRVPRAALQEMLFPNSDERSGAHSLRQLLYKLRQLGVSMESTDDSIVLREATQDVTEALFESSSEDLALANLASGFLPGYSPSISESFERWLQDTRSVRSTRIRVHLITRLKELRESGDCVRTHSVAASLLKLDPFNEEATLALAQVLALTGQKYDAVQMLDRYAEAVGRTPRELAHATLVLRRRVSEMADESPGRLPLIGRSSELSMLLGQFARSTRRMPTVTMVWGDRGVGKTRLIQEFVDHVRLRNACVEYVTCHPHDAERPLGALIDLVPKLLDTPGAIGVSPKSLHHLRSIAGYGDESTADDGQQRVAPELMSHRLADALVDLFLGVAHEVPLVLAFDDAQFIDSHSVHLLINTTASAASRIHVVFVSHSPLTPGHGMRASESTFMRQLEPLPPESAAKLLSIACARQLELDDPTVEQCVSLGAGNALFLRAIAEHLLVRGGAPSNQVRLTDLLRQRLRVLEPSSMLLLRSIALLGGYCTHTRLTATARLPADKQLLALQDLSDKGFLTASLGGLKCSHEMLEDVIIGDTPSPLKLALWQSAAEALESDGLSQRQPALLRAGAERWELAGNRARAAHALRCCADLALKMGEPLFACVALEKAQELVKQGDQLPIVAQTIHVAELAYDSTKVLANVARYRRLRTGTTDRSTEDRRCDLAEINALRRLGKPYWQFRQALRESVFDRASSHRERLTAARLFLFAAEQHLAKSEAVSLFDELEKDGRVHSSVDDWLELRMIYNCCFGDMTSARHDAEELVARLRKKDDLSRINAFGNAGLVMFRGGSVTDGFALLTESVDLNNKLGLPNRVFVDCVRLSESSLELDDLSMATHWYERAEQTHQNADSCQALLSSIRMQLALSRGDAKIARRELVLANSKYPDPDCPWARRMSMASSIRIAVLEGALAITKLDCDALNALDRFGRDVCGHDAFAAAMYHVDELADQIQVAAERFTTYAVHHRRELYPLPSYAMVLVGKSTRNGSDTVA